MTTSLGKSCSFGLLCLLWAFVKFCVCPSFPFGIEGRICVVIVLIPDHCFSIYSEKNCSFGFHERASIRVCVSLPFYRL